MAYNTSYGIHVVEARNRVATYLQDSDYTRWTKHELNGYIQQGAEDFVRRVGFPIVSHSFSTNTVSSLLFDALVGTPNFTIGETITGGTTQTTGVVTAISGSVVEYDTEAGVGFQAEETVTGASSGLSGVIGGSRTNYDVALPEIMTKLSHVEVDGKEVSILTESEIRYLAVAGGITSLEDTTDKVIKLFTGSQPSVPKWRETTGKIQAIVSSSASCEYFRLYPIPDTSQAVRLYGVYRPLHCSDVVPYRYMKGNVVKTLMMPAGGFVPGSTSEISDEDGAVYTIDTDSRTLTLMQNDVATSTVYTLRVAQDFRYSYNIDRQYMDVLVFGSLERAYLKEHDLRNVEKSEYYRGKKEGLTQEALRNEALNAASLSGGLNYNRLASRRTWPSRSR
tara:strand:+ start:629 stop:1807 length:1179 start_codon:yes stop_codon:yes gene_type:complete